MLKPLKALAPLHIVVLIIVSLNIYYGVTTVANSEIFHESLVYSGVENAYYGSSPGHGGTRTGSYTYRFTLTAKRKNGVDVVWESNISPKSAQNIIPIVPDLQYFYLSQGIFIKSYIGPSAIIVILLFFLAAYAVIISWWHFSPALGAVYLCIGTVSLLTSNVVNVGDFHDALGSRY